MRDIVLGKEVLNDEEVSSLSPGEIKPLHWIKNSPFLRVKINSPNVADRGWHWSSPFDVSEVADYPVKVHSLALSLFLSRFLLLALSVGPPQLTLGLPSFVKIRYTDSMQNRSAYILPVEVKPAGSTTHIVFDKQHEEFPPYRLENRCPHISLRYRQKAVNCQWEYLDPFEDKAYAWDDLTQPPQLELEVLESGAKKTYTLDKIQKNNVLKVRLQKTPFIGGGGGSCLSLFAFLN
jgi:hypothetical protein